MPLELEEATPIQASLRARPAFGGWFEFKRKVSAKDRRFFIEQLFHFFLNGRHPCLTTNQNDFVYVTCL